MCLHEGCRVGGCLCDNPTYHDSGLVLLIMMCCSQNMRDAESWRRYYKYWLYWRIEDDNTLERISDRVGAPGSDDQKEPYAETPIFLLLLRVVKLSRSSFLSFTRPW